MQGRVCVALWSISRRELGCPLLIEKGSHEEGLSIGRHHFLGSFLRIAALIYNLHIRQPFCYNNFNELSSQDFKTGISSKISLAIFYDPFIVEK